MTKDYKFTWYNSERSWKEFFSELKFAIKYRLADDQKKDQLYWEYTSPFKEVYSKRSKMESKSFIPTKTPKNKRPPSRDSIIKF